MSETFNKVSLGQVAQMLAALARKGWGSRELTMLGQATNFQLEDVRTLLQGRVNLVPTGKRWWKEGDDFVFPYPNEDRSGAELLRQDQGRFGERPSFLATNLLPKIDRIQGSGELVIVRCPFIDASYGAVLQQLLDSCPDLERAPQAAVLQLTAADVTQMGVPILIASDPIPDDPVPVVLMWTPGQGLTIPLSVRDCGHHKAGWWGVRESGIRFLLKRKAG